MITCICFSKADSHGRAHAYLKDAVPVCLERTLHVWLPHGSWHAGGVGGKKQVPMNALRSHCLADILELVLLPVYKARPPTRTHSVGGAATTAVTGTRTTGVPLLAD